MKIKIKQTLRSMWALILAVLMLLSTFSAVAVTLNTEGTGTDYGSSSVTFKAGEKIYYDLTVYGKGANIYNANGIALGTWQNDVSSIVVVTLTKDLTITTSSNLFQTEASGWKGVTCSTLPTSGQNMIVSTDGKNASWSTYSESGSSGGSSSTTPSTTSSSSTKWFMHGNLTGSWFSTDFGSGTLSFDLNENSTYYFKLKKSNNGSETWYGNNEDITGSVTDKVFTTSGGNCKIKTTVAGTYTFTIDTTDTEPKLSVTYPQTVTTYEVTLTQATGGTISGSPLTNLHDTSTINLTATADPGYTFTKWKTTTGSATFANDTSATTTATVTGACTISATFTQLSAATDLAVTATPSSCKVGDTITLGYTGTVVDDATVTYKYSTDDGSSWSTADANFVPSSDGTYKFRVTASKTGYQTVTSTNDAIVTVNNNPAVAQSVTLSANSTTVEKGNPITLTASLNNKNDGATSVKYSYIQTTNLAGSFTGTVTNTVSTTATFTPTASGTYKFRVTASCDGYNSVQSSEITVTVTSKEDSKGEKDETVKALFSNKTNNPSQWLTTDSYDVYKVPADSSYYTDGYTHMFDIDIANILANREFYFGLSGSTSYSDMYSKGSKSEVRKDDPDGFLEADYQNYGIAQTNYYFGKIKVSTQNLLSLTGVTVYAKVSGTNVSEYLVVPKAKTKPDGTVTIYAKNGTLKTTSAYGTTTVTGISEELEDFASLGTPYSTYYGLKDDRIVAQTVVKDTYAGYGWYVYAYVINGVSYPATKVAGTDSTYQMDAPYIVQEGQNVEITPIYLNTNIEKEDGYVTLYVDPNDLGDHWGNTISVYSYYYVGNSTKNAKEMNSAYPGEPMMLESTGLYKAFIPKDAWEVNADNVFAKVANCSVSGLTLNNYMEGETVHKEFLSEAQKQNYQTYDYDDFKIIAAAGYDTVKFDVKYRTNTTNQSTLLKDAYNPPDMSGKSLTITDYTGEWEDLTDIDGNLASIVGFTSNSVPSEKTFDTTEENKLYIVSTGNQNTSMGKWSTVWYVYDHNGNYITQGLPSDFIPQYTVDNEGKQTLKELTKQTPAYQAIFNANKNYEYTSALIAYESEQNAKKSIENRNTGIRLDGRWYYASSTAELSVTTHVLYANSESDTDWTEDTYNPDFTGVTTGALATVDDIRTTKVTRNTSVTISATPSSKSTSDVTYKFIGWATDVVKNAEGKFTPTKSTTLVDSTSIFSVASNTDAYALYVPVGEGDLVITHSAYSKVNPNANGGTGRYFVQAVVTHSDGKINTYNAQNGVTVPIRSDDQKVDVTLYTISTNGCTYVGTYVYNGLDSDYNDITENGGKAYVGKVNPTSAPATVTHSIQKSQIFDGTKQLTSTLDYYSDLKTNTITVKLNYYDRKVAGGTPVDINSTATTYSYKPTSYPESVYETINDEKVVSLPKLITYVVGKSVKPDNLLDTYYYWTSQADAETAMQKLYNYHSKDFYTAEQVTYHTNQYGEPQQSGEKWVTYYDKDGVEITDASKQTAEHVSTISIWYFNTPKKYTYSMSLATKFEELTYNSVSKTYYGTKEVMSGVTNREPLFYNQRLGGAGSTDKENAPSDYLRAYGINKGYVDIKTETARTIDVTENNVTKTLKFIGWATDTAGKNIVTTNYKYGLRITGNVKVYAIYGESELDHPGVNVQGIKPEQYFDQNNVAKTRISTMFSAYNCPDNDTNIENIGIVYLRVATSDTVKAMDNLTDKQLADLRKSIAQVVSKADYAMFKSGSVDSEASKVIVDISGSTASGFKYKVVDPANDNDTTTPTGFKAVLNSKNRGQFTHIFSTDVIKGYTYYTFATMGYKNYPSETSTDASVYKDATSGITYITSDNFAKFEFDSNGVCNPEYFN